VVRNCDIHHNGQIGIVGNGKGIRIEDNHIWSNNTKGFDPAWEAGGAKIAVSDRPARLVLRGRIGVCSRDVLADGPQPLADVAPDPSIDHGNMPVLDRLVGGRPALINQLRAVLLERALWRPRDGASWSVMSMRY
jgi:hypothetical protein